MWLADFFFADLFLSDERPLVILRNVGEFSETKCCQAFFLFLLFPGIALMMGLCMVTIENSSCETFPSEKLCPNDLCLWDADKAPSCYPRWVTLSRMLSAPAHLHFLTSPSSDTFESSLKVACVVALPLAAALGFMCLAGRLPDRSAALSCQASFRAFLIILLVSLPAGVYFDCRSRASRMSECETFTSETLCTSNDWTTYEVCPLGEPCHWDAEAQYCYPYFG